MKFHIILLLFPFICLSQIKQNDTNFFIENNKVIWQKVYELPNTSADSVYKIFHKKVFINLKTQNQQYIDNISSFEISDDLVNYKKYGGSNMGTAMYAQYYYNYLVVVEFKENKYRVTIKEINIDNKSPLARDRGLLEEYITKRKNSEFITNSIAIRGLTYIDKHFTEKFSIPVDTKDNW